MSSNYFDDLDENKATLRSAKRRGSTFNQLIRDYNDEKPTILAMIPSVFEGFSGEIQVGVECTCCGEVNCVPVEHRFLCVPCWKTAGMVTRLAGNDDWVFDTSELSCWTEALPEVGEELDDETLQLLGDLDIPLTDEPLY